MGKVRTFGLAIAAMALATQPVLAGEEKSQRQFMCADGTAPREGNVCVAPAPSSDFKNAAPKADRSSYDANGARTTPPTVEDFALARDIMLIVADREMGRRLVDEMFTMTPEQFFGKAPQMRALEKEFPGITALLLKRMQVWFNGKFDDIYEGSIKAQSDVLARSMSSEDLKITNDFLGSEAGKAFTTIAFRNVSLDKQAMSAEMGKVMRGNKAVNFEAVIGVDDDAMLQAFLSLPDNQQDAIYTFLSSSTGRTLFSALDLVEQARLQFIDQYMNDHNDELIALSNKVFDDYQRGVR